MPQKAPQTILVIEDSDSLSETYKGYLQRESYHVVAETSGKAALACLAQFYPAALVLDLHLPDMEGMDILRQAHAIYPHLPIIVVTGDTSPDVAMQAMQEGAFDFILKPFPAARLTVTLRKALEHTALEREVIEWRQSLGEIHYHDFIGQSASMLAVYRVIESVASSKASVFITGESGTGKELAAQALHKASPRRQRPLVAINCGAIPRDLLESTLFGHVKGAFTTAVADHTGAARRADGGTLFLDEVTELPLDLQVKLLRFLQTGEVEPVGGKKTETVDVRIVAATNRDPKKEVKEGRLREDLYYRLHVVPLELPPLRERETDVILLAEHFLKKFSAEEHKNFRALDPKVSGIFRHYEWPGNVRQLENIMRSIVVLNDGLAVTLEMLPDELRSVESSYASSDALLMRSSLAGEGVAPKPLWQVEKEAIKRALEYTGQDVVRAASFLEVSPSTLYRKIQVWRGKDSP